MKVNINSTPQPQSAWLKMPDGSNLRYKFYPGTAPNKANVVLLQGRSTFIENYGEATKNWLDRGHSVWNFDLRGQGGSTRSTKHPKKLHLNDFEDYLLDLNYFLQELVLTQCQQVILFGISLGSHIGMRYLARAQKQIIAGIFLAPLLDVKIKPAKRFLLTNIVNLLSYLKLGEMYVPGYATDTIEPFDPNMCAKERYEDYQTSSNGYPEYTTGGPTIAWARALMSSIELQNKSSSHNICHTFLALSDKDSVVCNKAADKLVAKKSNIHVKTYKNCKHNILLSKDEVITQLWRDIDNFLLQT